MNRINYQGLFFGQFHSQVIDFRFEVHMGTLGPIKGTVEGQKWQKIDQKLCEKTM